MGWGDIASIVNKWLPSAAEHRRNKINALQRERDELLKRPETPTNVFRLERIAHELRILSEKQNAR